MKKCLKCPKQATLHITELKGGKSLSLHLCENCALEYLNHHKVGEMPEDLSGPETAGASIGQEDDDRPETAHLVCPHCGITFTEFRKLGRLGCPRDYEVFHEELLPLLESIHGETQHVGKFPPKVSDSSRRHYELVRLRNELKTAVNDEQYETAARLRDQIQKLENDLNQPQAPAT